MHFTQQSEMPFISLSSLMFLLPLWESCPVRLIYLFNLVSAVSLNILLPFYSNNTHLSLKTCLPKLALGSAFFSLAPHGVELGGGISVFRVPHYCFQTILPVFSLKNTKI